MEIQYELQPEDEPDIALPLLVVNLVNQTILGKTVTQNDEKYKSCETSMNWLANKANEQPSKRACRGKKPKHYLDCETIFKTFVYTVPVWYVI